MKAFWLSLVVVALAVGFVQAADPPKSDVAKSAALLEELQKNPDDVAAFNAWLNDTFKAIVESMDAAPNEAEKKLAAAKEVINSLKPESAAGKSQVTRGKLIVTNYEEQIALSRVSLADLEKQLTEKPENANDLALLRKYSRKVSMAIGPIARSEPDKAEALMESARELTAKLKEAATEKAAIAQIETIDRLWPSLARTIEHGKQLAALIGKPAGSLDIAEWTNGSALSQADLKGKVVLLDFWAIWCGPCIATFPHLREWQEKYSDRGLVIVGVTRYYGYEWSDAQNRAVRPMKKPAAVAAKDGDKKDEPKEAEKEPGVTHETEQAMLKKFAEFHGLKHRFALQTDDSPVAKQFAVQGIPQAVVIDRQGIVRLIRVGSGPANAKALHDTIEKLLAEKPVAAK
jgi:thiol-disulfide isomerase/thioredoxin